MNGFPRGVAESICCLVVSVAFVACSAMYRQEPATIEASFDGFDKFQRSVLRDNPPTRTVASQISDRYRTVFSPYQTRAALAKLRNEDVALLFRAADAAFFYSVASRPLGDMKLDVAELHRRGIASQDDDQRVYAALMEIRLFDEARAFARLHPLASVQAVPTVTGVITRDGRTTLLPSGDGRKLERKRIDVTKGTVVVVSSPICHFSQRAVRSIEADPALRPVFHDHAVWLVPPDQSTPFLTVAAWNRLHPHERMEFAYRRDEWPMIDRWETPVFYFFRGGRVVSTVAGWPAAGRKAELERSLKLAGLM